MAKMNIKKGDKVLVITGKDTGKTAEVLSCFPEENKVTVKGLNIIVKHNKPKSAQDKGGIVKKEGKILASNVMVVCPSCDKATRVAHQVEEGKKSRVCKHCGANLDNAKKATKKSTTTKTEAKPAKVETKKAETKTTAKKETSSATKTVDAKVENKTTATAKTAEAKETKVVKAEPAKKTEEKKTSASAEKKTTSTKSAK